MRKAYACVLEKISLEIFSNTQGTVKCAATKICVPSSNCAEIDLSDLLDTIKIITNYINKKRNRKYFAIIPQLIVRKRKPSAIYLNHKEETREMIKDRLKHFNAFYNFTYKRIAIKNHKARWGSCSKRGNLNFNYRLLFLPPRLLDYVVVHELCHLGEFNHSNKFWVLVEKTIPDWRARRKELMNVRVNFRSLKKLELVK
jgi:predicted metal-dependent hydrolase